MIQEHFDRFERMTNGVHFRQSYIASQILLKADVLFFSQFKRMSYKLKRCVVCKHSYTPSTASQQVEAITNILLVAVTGFKQG